jgi:hypothetical protein
MNVRAHGLAGLVVVEAAAVEAEQSTAGVHSLRVAATTAVPAA